MILDRIRTFFSPPPRSTERADPPSFSIPVLCYHSWTIYGDLYGLNDHICLEQDLRALARRGYKVLPVTCLVGLLDGSVSPATIAGEKLFCLSFDDGRDFDFYDYASPEWGNVRSFHAIVKESADYLPQLGQGPRAVSFVIASPEARKVLDRTCGHGDDGWRDSWWKACAEEGIVGIANHSWDHVHDTLPVVRQKDNLKGSFYEIKTFEDAERQIADAQRYLDEVTGKRSLPVFGYPYGHVSSYLRDEYFPQHGARIGLKGGFSTIGRAVRPGDNPWDIPRFVCGANWKTPQEFEQLLDAVEGEAAACGADGERRTAGA